MKKLILSSLIVAAFSSSVFVLGNQVVFGEEKTDSRNVDINDSGDIELSDYFTAHGDAIFIDSDTVQLTSSEPNQFGAITLNSKMTFDEKTLKIGFDVVHGTDAKAGNGIGAAFHDGNIGEIGKAGINGSGLGILGLKKGIGFEVNTYLDPAIPEHGGIAPTGPHFGFVDTDNGDYLLGYNMLDIPLTAGIGKLSFYTHDYGAGMLLLRSNYNYDSVVGSAVSTGQEKAFTLAATTGKTGSRQIVKLKNLTARLNIPELKANNIEIQQDEKFNEFDPRIGLEATDKTTGDLTDKIQVMPYHLNSAIPGTYKVPYVVKNSRNEVARKTIKVKVNVNDTWSNGKTSGWKMFSGQDIQLLKDPENALVGDYAFYSDNHASLYKHFTGVDALEKGEEYRATLYVKPQNGKPESNRVKVSLKEDLAGKESRELINNFLPKDQLDENGYYRISQTFKVSENETNPLIVVENFSPGYIGSINISKIVK
ncbi:hypothetical protein DOK67_0002973 [Enterococcus sp. DIV0212c]|uniref:immunoglobulin-like domain-containing protein n=1 Tax=Enterococcus sp. DIV0212c TaxID=2230867 RepID=UPI001A9B6CC2|nr:immunoglobulin-like domain-containing protein [Enterococcus sp. DIV0212c]MBO1354875.1 DUF5011 domain-containing protein [Enterococcus sp. DIV0212c]